MGQGPTRFQLVATDLDGTLLNRSGELSEGTIEVLRELKQRGVPVVVCTARRKRSARSFVETYQELVDRHLIVSNGAMVYDAKRKLPIFHWTIPSEVAREIVVCIRKIDSSLNLGLEASQWYVDRIDEVLQARIKKFRMADRPVAGPIERHLEGEQITKIYFIAEDVSLRADIQQALEETSVADAISFVYSGFGYVGIMAKGVNKGSALRRLSQMLRIPASDILALGDEENDIEMLETAGFGVAMGNGSERLKAMADFVTEANDRDGWAKAVERFVLQTEYERSVRSRTP